MSNKSKSRVKTPEVDAAVSEIARLKIDLEQERGKSQRYRLAAESATNLIYEWDLGSRVEWLGQVDELLGYQPNEIPRTWEGYTSLIHAEDRDRVLAAVEKQLKSEEPYCVESRVRRKDGTYLYWQDRGTVVRDESGKPVKWLGAISDITELKRAQDALATSEEKYRKAFYASPDAININRLSDGLYVSINSGFTKIMGYIEQEIIGRTSIELNIWDDPGDRQRLVAGLRENGVVENLEARFRAKNGDLKYGLMSAALIEIDRLPHILSITRDITERKQAEKLREALLQIANVANMTISLNELFRSIHDSIGVLLPVRNFYLALHHPDRDEISFPYFVDQYDGQPPPHKTGRGLTEYVLRTGVPLLAPPEVFESLVRRGEVELIGEKAVDWLGVPLRIRDQTIGVMVVQSYTEKVRFGKRDLENLSFVSSQVAMAIERKQAEEALHALSVRQEAILSAIPDIIMEVDNNRIYTWANQEGINFFGEDVIGKEAAYFFEGEQTTYRVVQPVFAGNEDVIYVESWQRRGDGQQRLLAWRCRTLKDEFGNVKGALSTAVDITERNKFEAEIQNLARFPAENPGPVLRIAEDGMLLYVNEASLRLLPEWQLQFGQAAPPKLRDIVTQTLNDGVVRIYDLEHRDRNFVFSVAPILETGYANLYGRDITELKRAEEKLRESEKKYREMFDFLPIPVYEMDLEANITSANRAIYETFKGTERDLEKGFKVWQLLSPEDIEKSKRNVQRLVKGERVEGTEYTLRRLDGSVFPAIVISSVIHRDGKPVGLRGAIVDITERKQAEEMLMKSERRFRQLADLLPQIVFETDLKGNITFANQFGIKSFGYSFDDVRSGINFLALIAPEGRERMKKRFQENLSGSESAVREFQAIRKDGGTFPIILHATAILEDGVPIGLRGIAIDITERKQAEESLRHTEENFRRSLDDSPLGIRIVSAEGETLYANRAILGLYGYSDIEELRSTPIKKRYTPESCAEYQVRKKKRMSGEDDPREYEIKIIKKTGEIRSLQVSRKEIIWDGKRQFQTIYQDITERNKSDDKLQKTLLGLRKALGGIIQVLSAASEIRDPYTAGHQRRVADLARAIAQELALSPDRVEGIRVAGVVHDIGKLSIPSEILSKPGRLSKIEYRLIQAHAQIGHDILGEIEFAWPIADMILQHHERMDGSGYPQGLKDGDILLESRILAVSDVIEAMASHRPYRPALGIDAALNEIEANKGVLYDPAVVAACVKLFREKGYALKD